MDGRTKAMKVACLLLVVALLATGLPGCTKPPEPKNIAPTVTASASATTATAGETITFNATGYDKENRLKTIEWDWGDGTNTSKDYDAGRVIDHAYTVPGRYIVTVKVIDNKKAFGLSEASLIRLDILHPEIAQSNDSAPVAILQGDKNTINGGEKVMFNVKASWDYVWQSGTKFLASTTAIKNYKLEFGDGSAAVEMTDANVGEGIVNHTFPSTGGVSYPVKLTVKDASAKEGVYYFTVRALLNASSTSGVKYPTIFTMATIGEPRSLDPATCYETAGGEVISNCYETLVFYDRDSAINLVPMLATKVPTVANNGISPDGLNYTFEIRQDAKFHDGTPVNADAVVFSMKRVLKMDQAPAWILEQAMLPWDDESGWYNLTDAAIDASITKNSDYSVTFHLVKPYAPFLYCLAFTIGSIVSPTYVNAHGGVVAGSKNTWMDKHVCGSGPFKLRDLANDKTDWVPNQMVVLTRNDNYWREPAKLEKVIIKKADDYNTRRLMLDSGDADIAYIPRDKIADAEAMQAAGKITITKGLPTFDVDYLGMNQNISGSDVPRDKDGTPDPLFFSNKYMRRVFCYAFDYDSYVKDALHNMSIRAKGPIPKGMLGYDENSPIYSYSIAQAKNELALSNHPNGFSINLTYNSGNEERKAACYMLKTNLESMSGNGVVITVNVLELDWATFLDKQDAGELAVFNVGWAPDYADPDDYAYPFLHSTGYCALSIKYNNATIDSLIEQAAVELDANKRAEMYKNITKLSLEDAAYIYTSQAANFNCRRNWVQGYYFNPMYAGFYYYALWKA